MPWFQTEASNPTVGGGRIKVRLGVRRSVEIMTVHMENLGASTVAELEQKMASLLRKSG